MLDEQYLRQDVNNGIVNYPGSENDSNCKLELVFKGAESADRVMVAA